MPLGTVCGPHSLSETIRSALSSDIAGPMGVLKGRESVTLHVEKFSMAVSNFHHSLHYPAPDERLCSETRYKHVDIRRLGALHEEVCYSAHSMCYVGEFIN